MSELRVLLVDFGGVLTTSVWGSFSAFCEREGIDPESIRGTFRSDSAALAELRKLERGEVPVEEFERRFAARIGVEPEGLTARLFADLQPENRMVAAVRGVRAAGVPTGLISNSWGPEIYNHALLDEIFDAKVISGEVGLHKPEPEIYLLAAERLGVEPRECVFVDDLRENCAGAEAVGMTAIWHRASEQTVGRLVELLGVDLG